VIFVSCADQSTHRDPLAVASIRVCGFHWLAHGPGPASRPPEAELAAGYPSRIARMFAVVCGGGAIEFRTEPDTVPLRGGRGIHYRAWQLHGSVAPQWGRWATLNATGGYPAAFETDGRKDSCPASGLEDRPDQGFVAARGTMRCCV